MQVDYDEGVAIYIDPEPCVGVREDGDEPYARIGPVRICAGALSNERPYRDLRIWSFASPSERRAA